MSHRPDQSITRTSAEEATFIRTHWRMQRHAGLLPVANASRMVHHPHHLPAAGSQQLRRAKQRRQAGQKQKA